MRLPTITLRQAEALTAAQIQAPADSQIQAPADSQIEVQQTADATVIALPMPTWSGRTLARCFFVPPVLLAFAGWLFVAVRPEGSSPWPSVLALVLVLAALLVVCDALAERLARRQIRIDRYGVTSIAQWPWSSPATQTVERVEHAYIGWARRTVIVRSTSTKLRIHHLPSNNVAQWLAETISSELPRRIRGA